MATTICSSSPNPSQNPKTISFSSLSLSPRPSSLKTTPIHISSSSKFGFSLSSSDAQTIAAAEAAAVAHASAAAEAVARDGSRLLRMKRRRKNMRKAVDCSELWMDICGGEDNYKGLLFKNPAKSVRHYLTRKEEAEYTRYIKEEDRIEAARRRILETSGHGPTSIQWAKAMGMRTSSFDKKICSGRESRERITSCYRGLVVSIAAPYQGKGLSLEELIQEGSIGLLRGAKKFDPQRGHKLSTYAYWWIRQAVTKAVADKSRTIRLPGNMSEMIPGIAEANNMLIRRFRRLPSDDEIAQVVNMDVATVRLVRQRTRAPTSLDQAVTNQGCTRLQDIIEGPDDLTPETMFRKQQLKHELEKLLNILCEREELILSLRYGLNGEKPQSYDEIARLLNLSRERIRQINGTAMSKLQQSSVVDNLKVYMM